MKLDPKGIKAAYEYMMEEGGHYFAPAEPPTSEDVENAILAYLKATDTVLVPREPKSAMAVAGRQALEEIGVLEPYSTDGTFCYRAMIQAAEGK